MLRCSVLKVAGILVCFIGVPIAAMSPAAAATVKADTSMSVSALVVGGCTLSLGPSSPGDMQVDCPALVRFSVRSVSGSDASGSAPHRIVEVQY